MSLQKFCLTLFFCPLPIGFNCLKAEEWVFLVKDRSGSSVDNEVESPSCCNSSDLRW